MRTICIIPARYASTRFPGKPLALLGGKPIIEHVYERVAPHVDKTIVATDDERIRDVVERFGGEAVMTSATHRSGTDRCLEAYVSSGYTADVILNVQGDEPFIHEEQIHEVLDCFLDPTTQIATLVKPFPFDATWEELSNQNSPKVVITRRMEALYFSRAVIPYLRGVDRTQWMKQHTFYKHIGIYAYKPQVLVEISSLASTPLEKAESLEQLRWLENGYRIRVGITHQETIGIDTEDDLRRAAQYLKRQQSR